MLSHSSVFSPSSPSASSASALPTNVNNKVEFIVSCCSVVRLLARHSPKQVNINCGRNIVCKTRTKFFRESFPSAHFHSSSLLHSATGLLVKCVCVCVCHRRLSSFRKDSFVEISSLRLCSSGFGLVSSAETFIRRFGMNKLKFDSFIFHCIIFHNMPSSEANHS